MCYWACAVSYQYPFLILNKPFCYCFWDNHKILIKANPFENNACANATATYTETLKEFLNTRTLLEV